MAWDTTPTLAAGTDLPTRAALGDYIARNRILMENGRLLGCATGGAVGAAVNARGRLNTAAPAAGEVLLPPWWGRGQGNWQALDGDKIDVIIHDGQVGSGYACATPDVDLVSKTVSAGNILFDFFNRGTTAAGPLAISLIFVHSENR